VSFCSETVGGDFQFLDMAEKVKLLSSKWAVIYWKNNRDFA
jgi:hypothetical protein